MRDQPPASERVASNAGLVLVSRVNARGSARKTIEKSERSKRVQRRYRVLIRRGTAATGRGKKEKEKKERNEASTNYSTDSGRSGEFSFSFFLFFYFCVFSQYRKIHVRNEHRTIRYSNESHCG